MMLFMAWRRDRRSVVLSVRGLPGARGFVPFGPSSMAQPTIVHVQYCAVQQHELLQIEIASRFSEPVQ
jgi:hypothetical protein